MEMVNINIVDLVVDDERLTINSSVHLEEYDIRGVLTHLNTIKLNALELSITEFFC